ncbi:hypothetical protein Y032_0085g1833 [Ancylostoma ceylanicum]|uniref:EB domain-containing protein n=1 Tax=Ancylostoma ceylanicum TaxID=53326 RepID=A0A016TQ08_9BILA|nr:hypothetical protein Y032_0085g1833 [Ancylostoma ceylanicum]
MIIVALVSVAVLSTTTLAQFCPSGYLDLNGGTPCNSDAYCATFDSRSKCMRGFCCRPAGVGVDGGDPSTAPKRTRRDRTVHDEIIAAVATSHILLSWRGLLLKRRGRVTCFSRPQRGHRHRLPLYIYQQSSVCSPNEISIGNVCYPISVIGGPCVHTAQCQSAGAYCRNGICVSNMQYDSPFCANPLHQAERVDGVVKNCAYQQCSRGFSCEYNRSYGQYICCGQYNANYDYSYALSAIQMHVIRYAILFCALSSSIESFFVFDLEKIFNFFRQMQLQETALPELQCPFRRLDPTIRSVFHRFHNDLRKKTAQGQFKVNYITHGPYSIMNEVKYDCDMEEMAERPEEFYEVNEFVVNFAEINVPWKGKMVEVIQGVLQSWTETGSLQKMIHQNTTRIGCSYYMLPTIWSLKVICLYDNKWQEDGLTTRYFGNHNETTLYVPATDTSSFKTSEEDEPNRSNNYSSIFPSASSIPSGTQSEHSS